MAPTRPPLPPGPKPPQKIEFYRFLEQVCWFLETFSPVCNWDVVYEDHDNIIYDDYTRGSTSEYNWLLDGGLRYKRDPDTAEGYKTISQIKEKILELLKDNSEGMEKLRQKIESGNDGGWARRDSIRRRRPFA